MLIVCAKEFMVAQLVKRWSNIQSRVKEKLWDSKITGGGPPKTLSDADKL